MQPLRQQAHLIGRPPLNLLFQQNRPRDDITLELVGINLTDEYYIDPTTRSAVAAPGRALKLSLTAQF